MNNIKKFITLAILAITFCGTSQAQNFVELDFSDFDPSVLSTDGGSQVFADICEDHDVTVTSSGEFDATASFLSTLAGGVNAFASQHDPGVGSSNSHSFTFDFGKSVDIIIQTLSLDGEEQYVITGDAGSSPNYTNLVGSAPVVSSTSGAITLDGVGFGGGALGAADGETLLTGTSSVTVTYNATPGNFSKFGSFRVFKAVAVPEPNSAGLLALGGLALLGAGRRRRR